MGEQIEQYGVVIISTLSAFIVLFYIGYLIGITQGKTADIRIKLLAKAFFSYTVTVAVVIMVLNVLIIPLTGLPNKLSAMEINVFIPGLIAVYNVWYSDKEIETLRKLKR